MNHGDLLRRIRVSKNLSQDNVATMLKINQTSYSEWEHKQYIKEEKLLILLDAMESSKAEFDKLATQLNPENANGGGAELTENILKIIETQKKMIIKIAELEFEIKRLTIEKAKGNKYDI